MEKQKKSIVEIILISHIFGENALSFEDKATLNKFKQIHKHCTSDRCIHSQSSAN